VAKQTQRVSCNRSGFCHADVSHVAEIGYIIPAVFGRWRKSNKLGYNPFRDIRRNIFKHYDSQSIIRRPE